MTFASKLDMYEIIEKFLKDQLKCTRTIVNKPTFRWLAWIRIPDVVGMLKKNFDIELVAVEAKLGLDKMVFQQAREDRDVFSSAYVAFPKGIVDPKIDEIKSQCKRDNVGLLIVSEDSCEEILPPEKLSLTPDPQKFKKAVDDFELATIEKFEGFTRQDFDCWLAEEISSYGRKQIATRKLDFLTREIVNLLKSSPLRFLDSKKLDFQ